MLVGHKLRTGRAPQSSLNEIHGSYDRTLVTVSTLIYIRTLRASRQRTEATNIQSQPIYLVL